MERVESLADFLKTEPTLTAAPEPVAFPDLAPLTVKDFCTGILASLDYRRSILQRIQLGTLPPAVELRFYDYAHGKPADKVELTGAKGGPVIGKVLFEIVDPKAAGA